MVNKIQKIAIIGAGNGGRAFAAYFSKLGYQVNLIYNTYENLQEIHNNKTIESSGLIKGKFSLNLVTNNFGNGIKDVRLILIVLPANLHLPIVQKIIPYLHTGQILLLNPGRTFGAIETYNEIKKYRPNLDVKVGETQTLLFTCRKIQDTGVHIYYIKNKVDYCFYPEYNNKLVFKFINRLFPQLNPVNDIFSTSLNNIGAIIHPSITIMNTGSICREKSFKFYCEGVTPEIAQIVRRADEERCRILKAIGQKCLNFLDWAKYVYKCKKSTYLDVFHSIACYKNINSPTSIEYRYLTEDIPTGLVPLISMGRYLRIPTPVMNSLVTIANTILGINFHQLGRTVPKLNLYEMIESKRYNKVYNTFNDILLETS